MVQKLPAYEPLKKFYVFKQVSLSNFAWIFSDMSKNPKDCGQDLSNLYDYIPFAFRIKILTFSKKKFLFLIYIELAFYFYSATLGI